LATEPERRPLATPLAPRGARRRHLVGADLVHADLFGDPGLGKTHGIHGMFLGFSWDFMGIIWGLTLVKPTDWDSIQLNGD